MKVGFAGLSHLGLVSGICASSKGVEVVCFDPNQKTVDGLKNGLLPILEPHLDELFRNEKNRILISSNIEELAKCDLVYISLDIKTDDSNVSDLGPVRQIILQVANTLKNHQIPMVVLSQIPPGFMKSIDYPQGSLFYQVETLIFGRAVERALRPERYIVGCADPAKPLPPVFLKYLGLYDCPVLPMKFESAELCKIAINMFLATSVTMTNTIAEICESVGAVWQEMVPALRLDRRIGQYAYLGAGLGLSGGNIERDVATIQKLSKENDTEASAAFAITANSQHRKSWPFKMVKKHLLDKNPKSTIAVWGLAYKEDTKSLKNSPAIELLEALGETNLRVFDPQAELPQEKNRNGLFVANSALQACSGADALVVMTPWKDFQAVNINEVSELLRGKLVIDPLAVLDRNTCKNFGIKYLSMGQPE